MPIGADSDPGQSGEVLRMVSPVDVAAATGAMGAADSREALFLGLVSGALAHLDHVLLCAIHKDELRGCAEVRGSIYDERLVQRIRLPLSAASVVCGVARGRLPYVGPIPPGDPWRQFVSPAYTEARSVALVPVIVARRTVLVLCGPVARHDPIAVQPGLFRLADEAGEALTQLILRRRREPAQAQQPTAPVAAPAGVAAADAAQADVAAEERELTALFRASAEPAVRSTPSEVILLTRRKSDELPTVGAGAVAPQAPGTRLSEPVVITVHGQSNFYTGLLNELEEGGVFVATHAPLSLGTDVEFQLRVPAVGVELPVRGRVRWLREYDADSGADSVPGMGVRFARPPAGEALRALRFFIEQRAPVLYED